MLCRGWNIEIQQIGDAILMEKIVFGSPVNLPAIMLSHMQYCQAHDTHGLPFPHFIGKFMSQLQLYPSDVKDSTYANILNMITVRKVLCDEEEKVTVEVPPTVAAVPTLVPSLEPTDALLLRMERIEHAITETGRNLVNAITEAGKLHMQAVKHEALYNAEAHTNTQKLVHDLWECETNFIKQLDTMIRDRFIFSKDARKKKEGSVHGGEKGTATSAVVSTMAQEAKDASETSQKEQDVSKTDAAASVPSATKQ